MPFDLLTRTDGIHSMPIWFVRIIFLLNIAIAPWAQGMQNPVSSASADESPDPDFSPHGFYEGPLDIPHIVRFRDLPFRMHLEPLIPQPTSVRRLDERMVPLFERALREGTDAELQETAALSLARVAELKLASIESAAPVLLTTLQSATDDRIRLACARALASGDIQSSAKDLVALASTGDDALRLLIEPALIRWKSAEAAALWTPRISDPRTTTISFRLAAEGLARMNDMGIVESLAETATSLTTVYSKRMVAAKALALLNTDRAFAAGKSLDGKVPSSRLLAIALFDSVHPDSAPTMASYCDDPTDAVAAVAWLQTFARQPEVLLKSLATGTRHRDAVIRMAAARVMRLFPDAERLAMLQTQLGDVHLEVRNVARQMLVLIAAEHPELKESIIAAAGTALSPDSANWQQLEQSLILLGQLKATQFSPAAFALLTFPRDEVSVSAAWLIQLYPDESLKESIRTFVEKSEASYVTGDVAPGDVFLQEAMLLQYLGLVRTKEIETLLEAQFSKAAPGSAAKRASGLWALALLNEKSGNAELAKKYESRINDRGSLPPEFDEVRRASVLALGLLRSKTSAAVLQLAFETDSQHSLIPGSVRWAMPLIGQPMPPASKPLDEWIGGWRINPVDPG
jgi:hypothetical protein